MTHLESETRMDDFVSVDVPTSTTFEQKGLLYYLALGIIVDSRGIKDIKNWLPL